MAEPVSKGRIKNECVEEEDTANNSIKVETKAKLQLVQPNSNDEKENSLQDKECREAESRFVNRAEEP